MSYREDLAYKELERIITESGVKIIYQDVPDDPIDGAIWARADIDSIMMPETDNFPNVETACMILGHEMGHLLTGLGSPDYVVDRRQNEAICDLIGVYPCKLAMMTAEHRIKVEVFGCKD